MGKMIRISYVPGESGWAEDLGDGTARIANCPFGNVGFSIDDIVKLVAVGDGRPRAGQVIRRRYDKRSTVSYPVGVNEKDVVSNYASLWGAFRVKGWKFEGGVPGLGVLCHDGDEDPQIVADLLGIGGVRVVLEGIE